MTKRLEKCKENDELGIIIRNVLEADDMTSNMKLMMNRFITAVILLYTHARARAHTHIYTRTHIYIHT